MSDGTQLDSAVASNDRQTKGFPVLTSKSSQRFAGRGIGTRTGKLIQQIALSLLGRGMSMLFGLLMVRLAIRYCGPADYGIYVAITSVTGFLAFSEVGVGAGIRNKLTELLESKDEKAAGELVSSAYAQLSVVLVLVAVVALSLNLLMPWTRWLGIDAHCSLSLAHWLMAICIVGTTAGLVANLINSICVARGMQSFQTFASAASVALSCLVVSLAGFFSISRELRLQVLTISALGAPLLFSICASVWIFRQTRFLRPRLDLVRLESLKTIIGFGTRVFAINLTDYFIFTIATVFISALVGPVAVASVSAVQRIFVIFQTIFGLIVYTASVPLIQARMNGDIVWIRSWAKRTRYAILLVSLATIAVAFIIRPLVHVWLSVDVKLDSSFIFMQCAISLASYWNTYLRTILIAYERLTPMLVSGFIGVLINVVLAVPLGKGFGTAGILASVFLALMPSLVFLPRSVRNAIRAP